MRGRRASHSLACLGVVGTRLLALFLELLAIHEQRKYASSGPKAKDDDHQFAGMVASLARARMPCIANNRALELHLEIGATGDSPRAHDLVYVRALTQRIELVFCRQASAAEHTRESEGVCGKP